MKILENRNNIVIVENFENSTRKRTLDLWSYSTHVASFINYIDQKSCVLKLNQKKWDYSQTTLKHLKHFINDFIEADYYTTKKEFEQKISKNGFIYLVEENNL